MGKFKIGCIVVGVLVLLLALAIGTEFGGLKWKSYFAPKHAAVDREVFKNRASYIDGMAGALQSRYSEYTLNPEKKEAIAAIVRMEFSEFDEAKLDSAQLRGCWISEQIAFPSWVWCSIVELN